MSLKDAVTDQHPVYHPLGDIEAIPYHRLHRLMIGRAGEERQPQGRRQKESYPITCHIAKR